jgi:PPK2 family polyphosphate:nucleotide phosphotransferase
MTSRDTDASQPSTGSPDSTDRSDSTAGIPGVGALLGVKPGPVDLSDLDTRGTPGFDGGKEEGKAARKALEGEITDLQELLAADAYTGGHRRVLLVLQGMDTAGKGGVVKRAVGMLDPGGVRTKSFKAPSEEEKAHDFLWRIERETPEAGQIVIFDRSHYEDVLIARVKGLAEPDEIERRYDEINDFEHRLAQEGTTIVKCMLHISKEYQRERLLRRLDRPDKRWKFKPGDIDERQFWDDYQRAYEIALERCNTAWAHARRRLAAPGHPARPGAHLAGAGLRHRGAAGASRRVAPLSGAAGRPRRPSTARRRSRWPARSPTAPGWRATRRRSPWRSRAARRWAGGPRTAGQGRPSPA